MMYWLCLILLMGYVVLMGLYLYGWQQQPVFKMAEGYQPHTTISIVIAARNEEENIGKCIDAILAQQYPKHLFEVIIVDDHSTDATAAIVNNYTERRVQYIDLARHIGDDEQILAYKKKAIATGIAHSSGDLIITTDADCIAPLLWLMELAALYEQENPVMIVAPVDFINDNSIVQVFQSLDFMSMQGITAASHNMHLGNMSNGANLAFSKAAYNSVDGYAGIDHLASGDDYLLMMKLQKAYSGRISYLKSQTAIVRTAPQPDWKGFYRQRVRWASKSGKYDDRKMTIVLSFVYLFNVSFLFMAIAGIFNTAYLGLLGLCFAVKVCAELIYLYPVAGFFNKKRQLFIFPFLQPLHIFYIILVGFAGFAGTYQWKGRTIK
jgi:cellulose synthase/poly-beta-1,6-N-acetylglucosamine synthase-like glycosyltransferase